MLLDNKFYWNL